MAKGKFIKYSEKELKWICEHKQMPRRDAHFKFTQLFNRPDVSLINYNALCKRNGWLTGRTGRYELGALAWNKGGKMPFHPNTAKTQFKPGRTPHNTRYEGHERTSKDGYIEISVRVKKPQTGFNRRYVLKHRWEWEKAHGPLPAGMCLKCLDGDKANTAPANWQAIPRALLPRLNSKYGRNYDNSDQSVKPIIMATARLEHSTRELKKQQALKA